jgi:hypothetical protein
MADVNIQFPMEVTAVWIEANEKQIFIGLEIL